MSRITKSKAKNFLGDVPEEHVFYFSDGNQARNLEDLQNTLVRMNDDTFNYHSNIEKSDFSNWVKDVVGDEELAQKLRKAKDRSRALTAVSDRVAFLKKNTQ